MVSKIWNCDLNKYERKMLLRAAYPNRSAALLVLEADEEWYDLLPSTQLALRGIDWSAILDRDVRPD